LWSAGMGLAGMILTKETYVIHVGCAAFAVPVLFFSNKLNLLPDARPARQTWDYVDLAFVIAVGALGIVFFYSGTFFHWSGIKGLYQFYPAWFATGHEGHGHEKEAYNLIWQNHSWINYYWIALMARYEWPVLGGLTLCVFCQRFKNLSLRYLAIYGVGTLIAYSIVNYKTPWCIISFIWPFLFIFGAAMLIIPPRYRLVTYVASIVLLCASLGSTIWLNYFRCTTDTEPYVYVQTYNDICKLTRPLLQLAKRDPRYYQLTGHMIRTSAYPLPWILGDFPHIGYYEHENLPAKLDADFLLVQEDRIKDVEPKLHDSYYTAPLKIRAYQDTSKLYLRAKIFKEFFPGRSPDFMGKGTS
jgi:hypothetical protein